MHPGAKRVLLVEDDLDTREILKELFVVLGHDAIAVGSGEEALEAFVAHDPHVVFLDLGLPGIGGHEVARRLRERAKVRSVALIALTGWSRPVDVEDSFIAGIDLHLVKPVGLSTLRDLVGDLAGVVTAGEAPPSEWAEGSDLWAPEGLSRPR